MAAPLPRSFRFGVATAGFQIEGGYNGPGQPANNWAAWEQAGRVEPSGIAVDFWRDWEHHLDRAVAAGCDAFRLSVEWARCEPAEG
ncbi:MAG: beta-glucosidase, partial [Actinomycetota bacterium]|nr:beta-glucosidase [Actinomycetota bacterium]